MNTGKHTEERETILLTDGELDAVVGGHHDMSFLKHVDVASPVLMQ